MPLAFLGGWSVSTTPFLCNKPVATSASSSTAALLPNPVVQDGNSTPPLPPRPSFASVLSCDSPIGFTINDLPSPFVDDGILSVRISEEPYLRGLDRCKTLLIGRVSLPPKVTPLKSHELSHQLRTLWPLLAQWSVAPLGKGFFRAEIPNSC
ncbi:hypothetical protein M0R45_001020 [Rubus argutus]|uniref:Uncharacterized protein n=1 Tax=Rubus argutus TaxID=59490 RepID=A0AAW1VMR5_RUBAR